MTIDAWITLAVVGVLLVTLIRDYAPPDLTFLGAAAILAACKIITPEEAFAGFSNPGMLTVAFLFVVAAGLRETGVLDFLGRRVLGGVSTESGALLRLSVVVLPMSAFLNNTPIVAMFVPVVIDWCRRNRISPSKMLIPLSFLTILGGTCTLIGTSTNLVVDGLMIKSNMPGMSLFELARIGIPYAIIGTFYLYVFGSRLLPERTELLEQLSNTRREYLIEMRVTEGCPLDGKTVQAGGLRHLPGLFLIEIDREEQVIAPVQPDDVIRIGDRLVFTGIVSGIVELEKIYGLLPIADSNYEVSPKGQRDRRLCEAVISESSPLNGKTIRDAEFRANYGAAVVAVHRSGKRIEQKIGDISLRPGDTLLLQTRPKFLQAHRHDPAFYLVSSVADWRPIRRDRAWVAAAVFLVLLVLMTTGAIPIVLSTALAAVMMVVLGCLSSSDARQNIEWNVLITIGAAFGIGSALQNSGLAGLIAKSVVESTHAWGPIAALAMIYILGSIITELITNNAAAVLLFPFCVETARIYDVDSRPFLIALTLAASASFMTPIGYQTNMMVYGPGGYRFSDYLRIGAPLNIILGIVAVVLIPYFWPF